MNIVRRFLEYLLFRLMFRAIFVIVVLVALFVIFTGHAPAIGMQGLVDAATQSALATNRSAAPGPSLFDRIADSIHAVQMPEAEAATLPAGAHVVVGFSPGNAESVVVDAIDHAAVSINVAAYSFTSRPIASALVRAKRRGVDVRVVLDKSQQTERYSSATFLANEGIPVRIDDRYAIMHNKFMVIDGSTIETGSFNYTSSAAKRNAENALVIKGNSDLAKVYDAEWGRLWGESRDYHARFAHGDGG